MLADGICDRHHGPIECFMSPMVGMTFGAGWYDVRKRSPFEKYAKEGEEIVCATCMWMDTAYTDLYGEKAPADMQGRLKREDDGTSSPLPAQPKSATRVSS